MRNNYLLKLGKKVIKVINEEEGLVLAFDIWHERSELLCCTDQIVVAQKYIKLGWTKKRALSKIILLSPEIQLVDLSNPFKFKGFSTKHSDFKRLLGLFITIKDLELNNQLGSIIGKLYKKYFFILAGRVLEMETRIALYEEDKNLKDRILLCIEQTPEYKKTLSVLKKIFGEKERSLDIWRSHLKDKKKFKKIIELYRAVLDKDFNMPDNIYGFFKQLPRADYYLVIPHSGFKFIGEIAENVGLNRVLIYEKHFSKDGDFWFFKKNIKGKKVLIMDVSYSGKTIKWVADIVRKEGGTPIKVAVWPKGRVAIRRADYVMFLDKIIKRSKIDTSSDDWVGRFYKKIAFNNKQYYGK